MVGSHRRALIALTLAACGGDDATTTRDAAAGDAAADAAPCSTLISYGERWLAPANHPDRFDTIDGVVDWDGTCTDDGANSYAQLSNGFKPYFSGHQRCAIALDSTPSCGAPTSCVTRVTYGTAWLPPPNHPAQYDDLAGRVFWDGGCDPAGADSSADLSNGFQPHFSGAASCGLSQRWTSCGGLYVNSVASFGCADPGVAFDGTRYIASCTSGNAANAFPIYVSTDLVTWTPMGHILPAAAKPAWAVSDYWAPELHQVGSKWVAYFSARQSNGRLAIGAASADDPLGPYIALATPIMASSTVGLIDANEIDGVLLWKEDGNAQSAPTPIKARALAADGLSFASATTTSLITNDLTWEGNLVEGPWIAKHGGMYYLFYSGNAYYDSRYAIGVARAASLLGPYTKAPAPIVITGATWIGPGHNSVVPGPGGDDYLVYHAWEVGHVNGTGDSRHLLVDQLQWDNGWPRAIGAPSDTARPRP